MLAYYVVFFEKNFFEILSISTNCDFGTKCRPLQFHQQKDFFQPKIF